MDPDRPFEPQDVPEALRTPAEREALEGDALRSREARALDAAVAAFVAAQEPSASADVLRRFQARLGEEAPASSPSGRLGTWLRGRLFVWGPVLASVALVLVWRGLDDDGVRTRGGPVPSHGVVRIDAAVERAGAGILSLADARGIVHPGDGLLFRVPVEGDGRVVLLERDPDGRVSVLLDQAVVGRAALSPVAGAGQTLAWHPEGALGTYVYRAILLEEAGGAGLAEALWAAPGVAAELTLLLTPEGG